MRSVLIAAVIVLIGSLPGKAQPRKQISSLLPGVWTSYEDPNYTMVIGKDSIMEKYVGNEESFSFDYRVSDKNCGIDYDLCTRNCFYLVKKESGDEAQEYCYLIKALTHNTLTLVYEGGRVMDFKKKQ